MYKRAQASQHILLAWQGEGCKFYDALYRSVDFGILVGKQDPGI